MGVAIALGHVGLTALGNYYEPDSTPPFEPTPWWALAGCFVSGPAWRAWRRRVAPGRARVRRRPRDRLRGRDRLGTARGRGAAPLARLRSGVPARWARVGRFVGCPLRVHFPKDGAPAGDVALAVGWYPAWHATHRYDLRGARPAPDGGLELRVRQNYGAIWLGFEGAGLACDGADAEGRLLVASTRQSPEVACLAQPRKGSTVRTLP